MHLLHMVTPESGAHLI